MGNRALENRILKLKAIEAQQDELDRQAEAIKAEIKAAMQERGTDELKTGRFIIRWKSVISNKFDSKTFKAQYEALYQQFTRQSESRRFTIV